MGSSDYRYASTNIKIIIYGAALDEMMRGPDGEAMTLMMKRADYLQKAAKRQVRFGHIHGGGGHGNLRDSIVKRVMSSPTGGAVVVVGSDHPIALIHHEGTRAHMIRPRTRKVLRWPGASKSGWLFSKYVHHPGTKPNRFLTDNLPAAMKVN